MQVVTAATCCQPGYRRSLPLPADDTVMAMSLSCGAEGVRSLPPVFSSRWSSAEASGASCLVRSGARSPAPAYRISRVDSVQRSGPIHQPLQTPRGSEATSYIARRLGCEEGRPVMI